MKAAELCHGLLARKGHAAPSMAVSQPGPALSRIPTAPVGAPKPDVDDGRRVRLTLRLNPGEHRRLRVAAAHLDCSMQAVMSKALEAYLTGLRADCPCLGSCDSGEGRGQGGGCAR